MILILGVTASGKGTLAFELAQRFNGEIISVDSMKVYKRMDIGTAKPSKERRQEVRHHLIDVVEPSEAFSVDQFLHHTNRAIEQIQAAGKAVIAVGGTAMYIKALLYGLFEGPGSDEKIRNQLDDKITRQGLHALYTELARIDPAAARRIHPNDTRRIVRALEVFELTGKPISFFQQQWEGPEKHSWTVIGLRREKTQESGRINRRVKQMIEQGLAEEVRALLAEDKPLSSQAQAAIGYAEMIEHLQGKMNFDDTIEQIKINTRKLAKAQRTWFKTFRGVHWIDITEQDTLEIITARAVSVLADKPEEDDR
ncbi:MAG: tRNA (adenosine(37)-N6)-dimethylallyltransferase MiaA [Sedimentisphaerales bacterium]|nr:tRNA (adenosine(37)-N6)-dimethylallyltransferase MiaA [Sedimentisphaerales bacterium]